MQICASLGLLSCSAVQFSTEMAACLRDRRSKKPLTTRKPPVINMPLTPLRQESLRSARVILANYMLDRARAECDGNGGDQHVPGLAD